MFSTPDRHLGAVWRTIAQRDKIRVNVGGRDANDRHTISLGDVDAFKDIFNSEAVLPETPLKQVLPGAVDVTEPGSDLELKDIHGRPWLNTLPWCVSSYTTLARPWGLIHMHFTHDRHYRRQRTEISISNGLL